MTGSQKGPRPKHVPQRTCIACRQSDAKRQLVRLVRTAERRVEVDPTGKRPGRGAYLCPLRPCWTQALKRQAVARALNVELLPEDRAALEAYAGTLPEHETTTAGPAAP